MKTLKSYTAKDLRSSIDEPVRCLITNITGSLAFVSNEYLERDNSIKIIWQNKKEWGRFVGAVGLEYVSFEKDLKEMNYVYNVEDVVNMFGGYKNLYIGDRYGNDFEEELLKIFFCSLQKQDPRREEVKAILNQNEEYKAWDRANRKANRIKGDVSGEKWKQICDEYNKKMVKYE